MNLPSKIKPLPLIQSAVEIRFEPALKLDNTFTALFPKLSTNFPIATPISSNTFGQNFSFKSNTHAITIFQNIIVFDVFEYTGWENYLAHIRKYFEIINATISFESFTRVGIRNINIFDQQEDVNQILKEEMKFKISGYKGLMQTHSHLFIKDKYSLLLQLAASANAENPSLGVSKTGPYVDIDCSTTVSLDLQTIPSTINELHKEAKILFFSILNSEFINSLNPEYDGN